MEDIVEQLKALLARPVWGDYTVLHLLILLGVLFLVWIVIQRVLLHFRTEDSQHYAKARCLSCGWTGKISVHIRQCPKCNSTNFAKVQD